MVTLFCWWRRAGRSRPVTSHIRVFPRHLYFLYVVLGLRGTHTSMCFGLESFMRVLIHTALTNKKATARVAVSFAMVEAAGIEPASVSPLPLALQAYPRLLI